MRAMPLQRGAHDGEGLHQVALVRLVPGAGQRGAHGIVTCWVSSNAGSSSSRRSTRILSTPSTRRRTRCWPPGKREDLKVSVSVFFDVIGSAAISRSPTTSVTRSVFQTFGVHFTGKVTIFPV